MLNGDCMVVLTCIQHLGTPQQFSMVTYSTYCDLLWRNPLGSIVERFACVSIIVEELAT